MGKDEEAKDPTETLSEGETKQKTLESSEQVSSKDQGTTEKSSEGEIRDETKDIARYEDAKDLTEKSSEGGTKLEEAKDLIEKSSGGETIQETPESYEKVSLKDQDTKEKSSECEIKDETKDIKKE